MSYFETIKMFDLARAPADLREAEDLAPLRPQQTSDETLILKITVGNFETPIGGSIHDGFTREVTYTEYQLHRWLTEAGASRGEAVLLCWKERAGADH